MSKLWYLSLGIKLSYSGYAIRPAYLVDLARGGLINIQ
jgi:hypothetical protein